MLKKKPNKKHRTPPVADPALPQALPLKRVGVQIGMSYWAVLGLVNRGGLRAIRLPGKNGHQRILVSVAELRRFIDEGPRDPKQADD